MSLEEDNIELRDLVAQTLEANGVLAKIKAQLRASVFLALDEDEKISNQTPLLNNKVHTYLNTEEGKAMFCIVHDFLEFCGLKFTLSVYEPESYLGNKIHHEERQRIVEKIGLESDGTKPLLLQLLQSAKTKSKSIEINLNIGAKLDEDKSASIDTSDSLVKTVPVSDYSEVIENDGVQEVENIIDHKFNATFDLSSPSVNVLKKIHSEQKEKCHETNDYQISSDKSIDKKSNKEDDTYGDTSSLVDDPVSSPCGMNNINKVSKVCVSGSDDSIDNEKITDTKTSSRSEKLKVKSSLNSMADLPSLQPNKSRVNDILPSLYSKEFKEKSNLRELDKLFELEAEYEEDFICDGDDLSLKSERSKLNLLDELQNASMNGPDKSSALMKNDGKQKTSNKQFTDSNKTLFKNLDSQKSTVDGNSETNSD